MTEGAHSDTRLSVVRTLEMVFAFMLHRDLLRCVFLKTTKAQWGYLGDISG